ncbi:MAG: pantoate--beta-alanine ligase [Desulfovibrio sp.]
MKIVKNPKELQEICWDWRSKGFISGVVPTMGYLHEGHFSLLQAARKNCEKVVATIFVNPTQFGPNEDLDAYPRDIERDTRLAKEAGVDVLFTPEAGAMYSEDHSTWVEVPDLAKGLCASTRPTHFRGVATVVTKLLMLTMPRKAFFGQKDWQQLALIKRMVQDLDMPIEVISCPIIRESDGLAKSSRNVYLSDEERKQVPHIHMGLQHVNQLIADGERDVEKLRKAFTDYIGTNVALGKIDYAEFVHPERLTPINYVDEPTLLAVAVFMQKARLIDNLLLG